MQKEKRDLAIAAGKKNLDPETTSLNCLSRIKYILTPSLQKSRVKNRTKSQHFQDATLENMKVLSYYGVEYCVAPLTASVSHHFNRLSDL